MYTSQENEEITVIFHSFSPQYYFNADEMRF